MHNEIVRGQQIKRCVFRYVSDLHIKRVEWILADTFKNQPHHSGVQSTVRERRSEMYLNASYLATFLLLAGLAIAQLPTQEGAEESKSKEEGSKEEEPRIEQTGEDVDRSKKSILPHKITGVRHTQTVSNNVQTVNIQPEIQSTNIQFPLPVQTVNIQERQSPQINIQPAVQTLSIQPPSQTVQTVNIQPPSQTVQSLSIQPPSQTVQSLSIQPPSQTVQTLSIQPPSQTVQSLNIQPPSQTVQTLSIQPLSQTVQTFQSPKSFQSLSIQPVSQTVQTLNIQNPRSFQTFNIQPPSQTVQTFQSPRSFQSLSIQPASQTVQTLSVQSPQFSNVQTVDIQPGSILNMVPRGQTNVIAFSPRSSKTVRVFQQTYPGSQTNVNIVQPLLKEPAVEKVTRTEKIVEKIVPERVVVSEVEKEIVTPVFAERVVVDPRYSVSEPETMAAYVKYPFKYGKSNVVSTVKSKLLVEHPSKVMEIKEHALYI